MNFISSSIMNSISLLMSQNDEIIHPIRTFSPYWAPSMGKSQKFTPGGGIEICPKMSDSLSLHLLASDESGGPSDEIV